MSNFIDFGSSSPLILVSFGPTRPQQPGSPPFVFSEGAELLELVGWGCGGELVRRDAVPPAAGC